MEPVLVVTLFGMACSITLGYLQRADAAEEKALTPEVLARFRKDHGREPSSTELMYAVQERQCEWRRERRAEKKARRKAAKTA
jgi:hypothetical protein